MADRKWVYVTLSAFLLLGASFFFFLGSVFSLFGRAHKHEKGNIAVVEVLGGIFDAKPVTEELRDLKKDDHAKAVVLRVDSPGGSVAASQEIFEAVKSVKDAKPVVVSMGTVAASGGYYIAAPASRIVSNAGTITGSIGVRMDLMNVEDLLGWARLKAVTLKSGALKDVGSPTRPMTPEEREYLEGILKAMHAQFKTAVAENRGIAAGDVDALADGRVFTGEEALKLKLVDELGSLDRAVKVAAELAGLKEEPEPYYPEKESEDFLKYLVEGAVDRVFDRAASLMLEKFRFDY
ncbi:MAG TPA: signal peptide peptidase SppA [bacterium]|nr:signal peptide peptidase SppA [bacterium]